MYQCTNASGLCGLKECKGKDSRQPFYPCEFLLRAQNAEKSTYFYFSPSEVLWKSGITINMFCGDFLKFLPIKSVLVSHEISFSLSFLGIFLSFLSYSHNHGNRAPLHHEKIMFLYFICPAILQRSSDFFHLCQNGQLQQFTQVINR